MIQLVTGNNTYAIRGFLAKRRQDFNGSVERYDGAEIDEQYLDNLLRGQSLFAENRLVVIDGLSANKTLWAQLPQLLEQLPTDSELMLIEPDVDKRSRGYKWLEKNADVKRFTEWTARERQMAQEWVLTSGKHRGIAMTTKLAAQLVDRVGYEQWRLAAALAKLELVDTLTDKSINEIIEPRQEDRVFELLASALRGKTSEVKAIMASLRLNEDPYRVFGLLASQGMQLTSLALGDSNSQQVAADTGLRPFSLSQLAPLARDLSHVQAVQLIELLAQTDVRMKTTSHDSWLLIEQMLLKVATSS
jgi:DNA polymerase-3 subunit delta